MPNPVENMIAVHTNPEGHGWTTQDTSHIKNVSLLESHTLLKCPCGWHGWVKNTALEHFHTKTRK